MSLLFRVFGRTNTCERRADCRFPSDFWLLLFRSSLNLSGMWKLGLKSCSAKWAEVFANSGTGLEKLGTCSTSEAPSGKLVMIQQFLDKVDWIGFEIFLFSVFVYVWRSTFVACIVFLFLLVPAFDRFGAGTSMTQNTRCDVYLSCLNKKNLLFDITPTGCFSAVHSLCVCEIWCNNL